jgi:hypothetical protein
MNKIYTWINQKIAAATGTQVRILKPAISRSF